MGAFPRNQVVQCVLWNKKQIHLSDEVNIKQKIRLGRFSILINFASAWFQSDGCYKISLDILQIKPSKVTPLPDDEPADGAVMEYHH